MVLAIIGYPPEMNVQFKIPKADKNKKRPILDFITIQMTNNSFKSQKDEANILEINRFWSHILIVIRAENKQSCQATSALISAVSQFYLYIV